MSGDPILTHPRYLAAKDRYRQACAQFDLADTEHGREAILRLIDERQSELARVYAELRQDKLERNALRRMSDQD